MEQIIIFVDCVGDIYFYTNGKIFGTISELGKYMLPRWSGDRLGGEKIDEVAQLNKNFRPESFLKLGLMRIENTKELHVLFVMLKIDFKKN